jgi:hybrid cluster-associated redox disulfide protein
MYYNRGRLRNCFGLNSYEINRRKIQMTKVSKDMIIGDILRMDPEMAGVLVAGGMHCVGCPSSQAETLEEAALVHGIEPDVLVARVNAFVESKQA